MAGDNKIHIQDYLDGLLSPEACHDFEMHIQEDSELRRQVEEARLVREIWRSVKLSDTDLDRVTWSTLDTQIAASIAGVSVLMLVQPQKTASCPGPWYNGLQLCLGSSPLAHAVKRGYLL